jgi:hypothetical protein
MAKPAKAADFLAKMNLGSESQTAAPTPASEPAVVASPVAKAHRPEILKAAAKAPGTSRQGLKHIGAYLDRETVEKIALLRARLDLDNSELVRLAIERLYAAESAKRKFGDA